MSEIEGRPCGYCGKPLFRKVFPSGRREEIRVFAKRRACSNVCGLRLWKLEMREDLIRASLRFDQPDACWEWQGSMTPAGYGRLGVEWETIQAHRYIYERLVGPIPEGLTIDHLCKNTRCVNPRHLEPVTAGVNTLRGDGPSGQNLRKTHCMRASASMMPGGSERGASKTGISREQKNELVVPRNGFAPKNAKKRRRQ
jgi:hypothetical protein